MSNKIIVLTGGGTAGHVTPNLALVGGLEKEGLTVHYIGTKTGIERGIVRDLPYHEIDAGKLRRYLSKSNISDVFKIFKGYRQSKAILRELKPALVFAKGGFVSVPVVYAAAKLKIPVILHESDYTPGLANRLCTKKAMKICLSFDTPEAHGGKGVLTGSPVRPGLLTGNRARGLETLGFNSGKPVVLIMGGSQGATALNKAVDECLDDLVEEFCVVHLRGRGNLNAGLSGKEGYRQYEYVDSGLNDIFAATDIALSRAGANAIFEYLALLIPSLLVPLPLSASRGDQILNARYFKKRGYADVIEQENLNPETLIRGLTALYGKRDEYIANMKASTALNGTANVLRIIHEYIP